MVLGAAQHETQPAERMQIIALGVHRIADRFPAYEEAFGRRLKETAADLIEDTALYGVARARDALGTNRLLHQIVGGIERIRALLNFVKGRGLAAPVAVDILLWQAEQVAAHFREEDRRMEEHITGSHPQGAIVRGRLEPDGAPASVQESPMRAASFPKGDSVPQASQQAPPAQSVPLPYRSESFFRPPASSAQDAAFIASGAYDPLLGPDSRPLPSSPALASTAAATVLQRMPYGARQMQTSEASAGALNDRQKRILDFFALRRRAPLKEVIRLFPDLSEKTVRNDLAELCRRGHLNRVGLAPRSHYALRA